MSIFTDLKKKGEISMKKKTLALLLSMGMTVSLLAGCKGGGGAADTTAAGGGASAAADGGASAAAAGQAGGAEASGDGEKITLKFTWWGSQSRHDYTQKILDAYTQEHPEIAFEAAPAGWDGYFDKLSTEAASGSMPDIVQMDYLYISTYAKNDSIADLQGYMEDGTIDVSGIDEALLNSAKIDGKMAGLVLSTSLVTFPYNPEVLEKAGLGAPQADWTWEDFIAMCRQLKDAGVTDAAVINPTIDTNLFNYWVRQHGEKLFSDDQKSIGYPDDKVMADFIRLFKEAMDDDLVPTPDEMAQIQTLGLEAGPVVTGDAAFTQNWNNYSTLVSAANDTIKMVAPPTIGAEDKKGLWMKPGMFLSIAETSPHKKEAAEFINWFLNSETANSIMMAERGTPSSSIARDFLTGSGKMAPQQEDMFAYVDLAAEMAGDTPAPDPTGMSEVNKAFADACNAAFYEQMSPEEAAASFRKKADEILARNNG